MVLCQGCTGNYEPGPSTRRRPSPRSQVMSDCHKRKWRVRDVQKASGGEGTVVADDTAALSVMLSGRVSFKAEETRRDEHDGAQG